MRSIELPGNETVRIVFDSENRLTVQDYLAFCRANPDLHCERTADGEIVVVPPAGGETSHRSNKVSTQLGI
jgi:Uma2 family endonuclease